MLLVAGAVLGLLGGMVAGGRLHQLLELRLRWPAVAVAALLVRAAGLHGPLSGSDLAPPLFTISLVVLILWALWHRAVLRGVWLLALGMLMNLAVVVANGGRMPVSRALVRPSSPLLRHGVWGQYGLAGPHTRLALLGDWIAVPQPLGRIFPEIYSPGDIVTAVGLAVVLFLVIRPPDQQAAPG